MKRQLRKRAASEEPNEEADVVADVDRDKLQERKLLQQLRKRAGGLDAGTLAGGGRVRAGSEEPPPLSAPEEAAEAQAAGLSDAYVRAKTMLNISEDDPHMRKFIEDQVAARLGRNTEEGDDANDPVARQKKLEAELYSVPERYKNTLDGVVDSTLAGTVATLVEAPLPASMRLHNVEQTEAFKRKMLLDMGVRSVVAEEEAERQAAEAGKIRRGQFVPLFGKDIGEYKPRAERRRERDANRKANMVIVDPALRHALKRAK